VELAISILLLELMLLRENYMQPPNRKQI